MSIVNYKLTISYDGSLFYGWASQPEKRTVQGEMSRALEKIFKKKIGITAAGRTDSKVHALNQVINFKSENSIPCRNLRQALNSLLPVDILVKRVQNAREEFNARRDAVSRTYIYRIKFKKDFSPFERNFYTYIDFEVDIKSIIQGSRFLIGEHDFTTFCSVKSYSQSKIRKINYIRVNGKRTLILEICANSFLMHMVRLITGSLFEVGRGRFKPSWIKDILEKKDNRLSGTKMAAQGLYLKNIKY